MTTLGGAGVLLTRPAGQSATLADAIESAGGRVVAFPVMEIVGRNQQDIAREASSLPTADLCIFVSSNAVRFGLASIPADCRVAAIGPATAAALAAAGRPADIVPKGSADSEGLLAHASLADVRGQRVRILRGNGGRELLGEALRERGAFVDMLETYRRQHSTVPPERIRQIDEAFAAGRIHYVIAMSVESFEFLLDLLPTSARTALSAARLVTPSSRVIQTARDRLPAMPALLADGTGATELVAAMLEDRQGRKEPDDG